MAGKEFVDGWILAQTLGEGAYGEVKLLVNRTSGEAVAMKTIDLQRPSGPEDVAQMVRKEVCVHNKLKHPNIIQYYGHRQEVGKQFIFLEYAAGGELFDRIEPDSGMAEWLAQKYFKQLIAGVEYMHAMGIAHRDLKPENLLLDAHDNLKISDFGMATVFRMRGNERLLDKRCGTLPYLAPEVLLRSYQAEPADLWACGIILVAMLTGELPWDQPTPECAEYVAWKDRRWSLMPWPKVEMLPLSLLQRMLTPLPKSRCKLAEIKVHRWVQGRISRSLGVIRPNPQTPPRPSKRQCSDAGLSSPDRTWARLCQSQPEPHPVGLKSPAEPTDALDGLGTDVAHMVSFSQPAQLEDLLLSSQLHPTQNSSAGSQQSLYQKLVRRMTRFFVQPGCEESQHLVTSVAGELGWVCRTIGRQVTITCMDRRKMPLTFKLNILYMDGKTLLDFRLSKGCGLEFKRNFLRVKEALGDTVLKGPVTWPIAIATNSVP